MKKAGLVFAVALLIIAMLATPIVSALPGEEKSNDKFVYFNLICSGVDAKIYGHPIVTYTENSVKYKTFHGWDSAWTPGSTVELTIGEETFTKTTSPYSVGYDTVFDLLSLKDNDGVTKMQLLRLTDTVSVYYNGEEIGTIILNICASIDATVTPPKYSGTIVGYGTGDLRGVHISAVDDGKIGADPIPSLGSLFSRTGTIMGWPEQITNS